MLTPERSAAPGRGHAAGTVWACTAPALSPRDASGAQPLTPRGRCQAEVLTTGAVVPPACTYFPTNVSAGSSHTRQPGGAWNSFSSDSSCPGVRESDPRGRGQCQDSPGEPTARPLLLKPPDRRGARPSECRWVPGRGPPKSTGGATLSPAWWGEDPGQPVTVPPRQAPEPRHSREVLSAFNLGTGAMFRGHRRPWALRSVFSSAARQVGAPPAMPWGQSPRPEMHLLLSEQSRVAAGDVTASPKDARGGPVQATLKGRQQLAWHVAQFGARP